MLAFREENKYGMKQSKITWFDGSTTAVAMLLEDCIQF
jgi:hypothetical protein